MEILLLYSSTQQHMICRKAVIVIIDYNVTVTLNYDSMRVESQLFGMLYCHFNG